MKSANTDAVPGIGAAYSQNMEYDVWDNMTSRSMGIWSGSGNGYSANYWNTYTNNRNTLAPGNDSVSGALPNEVWQYDAAGMPTQTGQQTHKYDASGRKIQSVDMPIVIWSNFLVLPQIWCILSFFHRLWFFSNLLSIFAQTT